MQTIAMAAVVDETNVDEKTQPSLNDPVEDLTHDNFYEELDHEFPVLERAAKKQQPKPKVDLIDPKCSNDRGYEPVGSAKGLRKSGTTSLVEEVEILQKRVRELEEENMTLKRNMGILYRTALAELSRKDNLLLMQQQQSLQR
jgi:hypothetical protein